MKKLIIAIDGYSACGKSTTAKETARQLGYAYIDTGAMYRAVTLFFLQHYITTTNEREVEKALEDLHIEFHCNQKTGENEIFLNGLNVESQIRTMEVSNNVSQVSALPRVRQAMVAQQKSMGQKRGVVMDGRDIGTAVFPEADLKIFMVADPQVRAERRQEELLEKGQMLTLDEIAENLRNRDHLDTTRQESPLRRAEDAVLLDTTHLSIEEQVRAVVDLALEQKEAEA